MIFVDLDRQLLCGALEEGADTANELGRPLATHMCLDILTIESPARGRVVEGVDFASVAEVRTLLVLHSVWMTLGRWDRRGEERARLNTMIDRFIPSHSLSEHPKADQALLMPVIRAPPS